MKEVWDKSELLSRSLEKPKAPAGLFSPIQASPTLGLPPPVTVASFVRQIQLQEI